MKFSTQPYFIVSFDGGGVRGILSAALIERLAMFRPGLLKSVDLYSGTSTGSIIAASLAAGMTPTQIREAYEHLAPVVFKQNRLKRIPYLGNALSAKYGNRMLRQKISAVFGEMTLGELPKKILIAAFDLDGPQAGPDRPRSWRPKFFNNYQETDLDIPVVEAILCSAAAPTYFPAWTRFIDGGVAANNPGMAALAQAIDQHTGHQNLENIRLLSFGTGQSPAYLSARNVTWGWLHWVSPLIDIMLDGNVSIADYQVKRLLGDRYLRINPVLERPVAMDDAEAMGYLEDAARKYSLRPACAWIDQHFGEDHQKNNPLLRGQF